jgi:hypothetical protein
MVMNSITFSAPGFSPPAQTPRVDDEQAAGVTTRVIKSPKSMAFPVDEIVT